MTFRTGSAPTFGETWISETIPSKSEEKVRVIESFLDCLQARGLIADEQAMFRYRLCLDEVVQNALEH
ncbi:MAG: hypothetical protein AAF517_25800, partial [Planctomycetota bacterium]